MFICYKTPKGTLLLPSFTRVTLRVLALLGQVTWGERGGGEDRADRELRPDPNPISHRHPRFLLPIAIPDRHCYPMVQSLKGMGGVLPTGGGRLQPVLMRPTPQLSVKTCGGGGGIGAGGGDWQLSRGEGLRATHYYHMHT